MTMYAYCRVSTTHQKLSRQITNITSIYDLPKYVGTFPVDAVQNAAIAPLSGIKPVSVGQFISGWVDRYSAPPLIKRQALSSFSYVSEISKLVITISACSSFPFNSLILRH